MKCMVRAWLAVTLAVVFSTAASANDETIGKQIVERLQQQRQTAKLEGFNVGVKVDGGTVTMSGNVTQPEHASAALDIARRVPGVKLVVNDLRVQQATAPAAPLPQAAAPQPVAQPQGPTAEQMAAYQQQLLAAQAAQASQIAPTAFQATVGGAAQPQAPAAANAARPMPAQQPVAFARSQIGQAQRASYDSAPEYGVVGESQGAVTYGGGSGEPVPMATSAMGAGGAQSYDNPQVPGYAWPSYAAYPNYAAVSYPHQYSPTAWPYIGPFYPYPQVPLGWRKVTMEWDDGWWFLDFKCK